ncbi:MAG: 3-phosphoserine/phosphohydroxythreonine transaminase [Planctomycetaceae bacterium]|jgi:phosphoserine aminotransferase|nr:3-phosphoserine/phosphohydroxythreonine transaminase [Planctomycetaceae bacterium]
MSEKRLYNFSAGPAVLPLPVLQKAQEELLCLPGAGASVMEISHRSKAFEPIINGAEDNIRKLLNVPANYRILFLQGGALLQFGMIPMNLFGKELQTVSADYIVTGSWSKKAASEAGLIGRINTIWDGKAAGYKRKPVSSELDINEDAAYVYICSNETIEGVQYQQYPVSASASKVNVPLVCDASSDFLSKPVDISQFGLLYACAQKNAGPAGVTIIIIREDLLDRSPDNIPSLLHYKRLAENKSMLNTPPTFALYIVKLVTDWLLNDIGGLDKIDILNREKAALLYAMIDQSGGFYRGHADKEYRSVMNVPFRLPSEELDKKFEAEAKSAGLVTLGGHRSVGGLRASIYNAMPKEGAVALRDFMADFQKKNG